MIPIELFWCCLPELEKTATLYAAAQFLLNPVFMERAGYETIFASSGAPSSLKRLELHIWTWGLLAGVIVVEEVEIEVYYFLPAGIPQYLDFWTAGEFGCDCICEILRFPDPC